MEDDIDSNHSSSEDSDEGSVDVQEVGNAGAGGHFGRGMRGPGREEMGWGD